jgi:hypothetical protein
MSGGAEEAADVVSSKYRERGRTHEKSGESRVDDASSTWFAEHRSE